MTQQEVQQDTEEYKEQDSANSHKDYNDHFNSFNICVHDNSHTSYFI